MEEALFRFEVEVMKFCDFENIMNRTFVVIEVGVSGDPNVLRPGTVLLIFLYFTPCLTFSLRLMVTHRFDSCDHLLYRLVTWYVPCLYCCRDFLCHVTYHHMSTDYDS